MKKKKTMYFLGDILGVLISVIVFIVPFLFMFLNSLKDRKEANRLELSFPSVFHWENYAEVFNTNNRIILTAFKNSIILTACAVVVLVLTCSMAGYILQRRNDKMTGIANVLIMIGLMMPPAIMPTIWVMQGLHIYKTMFSMVLICSSLQMPFTIMLYRGYVATVPKELEEAGHIDGCSKWQIFSKIIFPLLKPVTATVIILDAVYVFNDFTSPLYFFPGNENATVQLTLYNFTGQYSSSYNLLFADTILITIPMLILFIFFNKRIVDGMTAGAVKG